MLHFEVTLSTEYGASDFWRLVSDSDTGGSDNVRTGGYSMLSPFYASARLESRYLRKGLPQFGILQT